METTSSKKTVLRDLFYTIRANVLSMAISVVLFLIVPKFVSDTGYAHWQLFNLYITSAKALICATAVMTTRTCRAIRSVPNTLS